METHSLFHLAFPVHDLAAARRFYGGILGCREGRSAADWIDFDFFGHQLVAHLVSPSASDAGARPPTTTVDGEHVPVPHFGAILPREKWQVLATRLRDAGVDFLIEPHVRFAGEVGEQATLFLLDPSGNALEFKSFADPRQVFAK